MSSGRLRVRSPIHVGGAEGPVDAPELARLGGRLYRISTLALEEWLRKHSLVLAYLRACEASVGAPFSLLNFLRAQGADPSEVLPGIAAYEVACPPDASIPHLRPFCRDPEGLPYLPGSTIKGALRTAALADQVLSNEAVRRELVHSAEQARPSSRTAGQAAEREAFSRARYAAAGATPQQRDLWRFVHVGDSAPLKPEDVGVAAIQIWNLRQDGSPYIKLSVYAECLLPGAEVLFPLRVDERGLRDARAEDVWVTPEGILNAAARWAKMVWEDEAAALGRLGLPRQLGEFYRGSPAGVRLGWGSGWHSLGLGRLLPEAVQRQLAPRPAAGLPFPKTRRVAELGSEGPMPLGWGELELT